MRPLRRSGSDDAFDGGSDDEPLGQMEREADSERKRFADDVIACHQVPADALPDHYSPWRTCEVSRQ